MDPRTKIKLKYDLRWCAFLPVFMVAGTVLAAFAPIFHANNAIKDIAKGKPVFNTIKCNAKDTLGTMFIDIPSHTCNYLNKLGSAPQLAKYDATQKTK